MVLYNLQSFLSVLGICFINFNCPKNRCVFSSWRDFFSIYSKFNVHIVTLVVDNAKQMTV